MDSCKTDFGLMPTVPVKNVYVDFLGFNKTERQREVRDRRCTGAPLSCLGRDSVCVLLSSIRVLLSDIRVSVYTRVGEELLFHYRL